MSNETQLEKSYQRFLPWVLGGAMFAVYLATMAGGITLYNQSVVAELTGWSWPRNVFAPVMWLVTYPLRWLAASAVPFGLGLLTAAGGALTLGLLARSVMLLPHDRTQEQRERERSEYSQLTLRTAWLPPVLAVLACGWQLTFWRNSTDGTGLILDALLFIYPVRCLLEHRIDGRQSWLIKAAFVYGLGMANHWLMMVLLPLFLGAMVWIKGVSFFNLGFLGRVLLAGFLGALTCLIAPLAQGMGADAPMTVGEGMALFFAGQKSLLMAFPFRLLWVLGLTSLLPVTILGIRWASSFGDNSPLGVALARFMFHVVHGVFLLVCLWGAFDSPLSPRVYPRQTVELHPYFGAQCWLPLYLLAGLAIGYYSGYFLLVFNNRTRAARHESDFGRLLNTAVTGAVWMFLVLVPVGLLYKNAATVRQATGGLLGDFGRDVAAGVPREGAILLSDDAATLVAVRAALGRRAETDNFLFLNTASLAEARYHEFLRQRYPKLWSGELAKLPRTNQIPAATLIETLVREAAKRDIYYLHPSFGYYFERFHAEPHGLAYKLKLYGTNALLPPPLSAETVAANRAFWKELDAGTLNAVAQRLPRKDKPARVGEKILGWMKARIEPDDPAILVGAYYSRGLDSWGADLQAQGDLVGAALFFKRALDLNPLNVVAEINAACNASLQAGGYRPVDLSKGLADKLGQYGDPSLLLSINGPFDEPQFCYQEGAFFAQAAFYRQAARQFDRVKALNPADPGAYLWLGQIYNLWRQPEQALALMRAARALPAAQTNTVAELVTVEATAHFIAGNVETAERLLKSALQKNPDDDRLANGVVSLLMSFQRQATALEIIEQRLRQSPKDIDALNGKGVLNLQLGNYVEAIPSLDRVLQLQPDNHVALMNRAIALLQTDRLDEARRDYEALAIAFPTAYQVYFGLGEIAYRRKDRESMTTNYQLYLKYAPANSDEARMVKKRLDELKSVSP